MGLRTRPARGQCAVSDLVSRNQVLRGWPLPGEVHTKCRVENLQPSQGLRPFRPLAHRQVDERRVTEVADAGRPAEHNRPEDGRDEVVEHEVAPREGGRLALGRLGSVCHDVGNRWDGWTEDGSVCGGRTAGQGRAEERGVSLSSLSLFKKNSRC